MDSDNPFAELQTVGDSDLAQRRGGFSVAGIDVSFGALVVTVVDGVIVLQTQFTATDQGMQITQFGPAASAQAPIVSNTNIKLKVIDGGSTAVGSLAPAVLNGPGATGLLITGPSGQTLATTMIDPMRISNAVVSNASNQSVSQTVEIDISLNNFSSVAQQIRMNQLGQQVSDAVQSALAQSISH